MKMIPMPERRPDAWLHAHAADTPERPFLLFPAEGVQWTYAQALRTGLAHARFLREHAGLRQGDHLGLMLGNGSAWVSTWLGSILGGIVDVGLHHELTGTLLAHQVRSANVKAVLCDAASASRLVDVKRDERTLDLHTLVLEREPEATLAQRASEVGLRVLDVSAAASCDPAKQAALDPRDALSIRFTSGTTGPAKAAVLTVSQVAVWADHLVQLLGFTPDDRIYAPFPLHHHLASVMGVIGALRAGGSCIVAPQFSARKFWPDCIAHHATLGLILDPVVNILLKAPPADTDRGHAVRAFYIARPNPAFEERFGCRLQTAYALTEASVLAFMTEGDRNLAPTCVGRVNPHFEVQVVDELDAEVARDAPGEIVYRPRHPFTTMWSYHGNAEATVKATRNQWFHTGDLGMVDGDGFLHFYERMGDTIRRRGVNIPAYHVEEVALAYPGIEEAVAVGVPSDVGEFEVKLCIQVRNGSTVDPQALVRWLCERLPQHMVPRYLEERKTMPRTITEKIIKRELKAEGITPDTVSTDPWIHS